LLAPVFQSREIDGNFRPPFVLQANKHEKTFIKQSFISER
jgi:hypothetical protein